MSNTKVTKQISNESFSLIYDYHEEVYALEVSYVDGSGGSIAIERDSIEDFITFCGVVAKEGFSYD